MLRTRLLLSIGEAKEKSDKILIISLRIHVFLFNIKQRLISSRHLLIVGVLREASLAVIDGIDGRVGLTVFLGEKERRVLVEEGRQRRGLEDTTRKGQKKW